jgi:protein TonB
MCGRSHLILADQVWAGFYVERRSCSTLQHNRSNNHLDARRQKSSTVMSYPESLKSLGQKLIGTAFVIIAHILAVYALINASSRNPTEYHLAPLEVNLIEEIKPTPKEVVPLSLKQLRTFSKVYPPRVNLPTIAPIISEFAITAYQGEVPSGVTDSYGESSEEKGQVRRARIDTKRPCPRPVYPAGSLPEEQQGTVVLKLLIATSGEVLESAVESSSGFQNLDEAARAALSRCLYKPVVNNRDLQQSWATFKYRWRLE